MRFALAKYARVLVLGVAVLFVGAAAATAKPIDLSGIRTIGVISDIGQHVALSSMGLTAFSNSYDMIDSSNWGIDEKATGAIADLLRDHFAIRRIIADPVAFSTLPKPGFLERPDQVQVPVEELVSRLTDRDGIDAYLVCYPMRAEDPLNGVLSGVGVFRRGGLGERFTLHAFFDCDLIDARTNKTLARGESMLGPETLFSRPLPEQPADKSIWAEHSGDLSAEQRDALRTAVTDLVARSLPWALAEIGLVPQPAVN